MLLAWLIICSLCTNVAQGVSKVARTIDPDAFAIWCREDDDNGAAFQQRLREWLIGIRELTLPNNEPPFMYGGYTQLCAALIFGGAPRSNMGGVCDNTGAISRPNFALDIGDYRLYSSQFLRFICIERCQCSETREPTNNNSPDQMVTEYHAPARPVGYFPPNGEMRQQILDNYDLIEEGLFPPYLRSAFTFFGAGQTGAIICRDQPTDMGFRTTESAIVAALGAGNNHRIIMRNGLSPSMYKDMTSLCASALFGGLPASNMGGVCLSIGLGKGFVAFWGASGRNIRWGNGDPSIRTIRSLRLICRMSCECADQTPGLPGAERGRGPQTMLPADEEYRIQGANNMMASGSSGSLLRPMYSESNRGNSASAYKGSTTGGKRTRQCPAQRRCTDFKCQEDEGAGCKCLAGDIDLSGKFRSLGCGILGAAITQGARRGGLGGWLITRMSLEESAIGCPCNASYVSEACCHDGGAGLVWEPSHMKLGSLHDDIVL